MGTNVNGSSDVNDSSFGFLLRWFSSKKESCFNVGSMHHYFAVVSLVWFFWGYNFVYGKSIGGIIGFSPSLFGLNGITINTVSSYAPTIPEILFFCVSTQFAAITQH